MLLFLIILAIVLFIVFSNMALYVAGGIIGLLIVLILAIVKRRKSR